MRVLCACAEAVSLISAVAACGICGKLGSGFLSEKITARYTMVVLLAMQMGAMLLFLLGSPNRLAVWTVRRRPSCPPLFPLPRLAPSGRQPL